MKLPSICLILTIMTACAQSGPHLSAAPELSKIDEIVYAYSDIAFLTKDGTPSRYWPNPHYLMRYNLPLKYSLHSSSKIDDSLWRGLISKHLETLAELTGKPIALEKTEDAVIKIYLGPASELKNIERHHADRNRSYCWSTEYSFSKKKILATDADAIAIAITTDELDDTEIEECILLTITRPLGFIPYASVLKKIIWAESARPRWKMLKGYAPVEKMIIKAHFDPRLQHGMLREKALPIFRKIIIELWPYYIGDHVPYE